MPHVFWQKHRATWISASVPCAPLSARRKTRNGECIVHPAFRLTPMHEEVSDIIASL